MKLLKSIVVLDLTAGVVSCLLIVTLYHSEYSQILNQLGRSMAISFFVGTPMMVLFSRFGARIYSRPFPLNWVLIAASILVCAFAGSLGYSVSSAALGLLAPGDFWSSFWARLQFTAVMALAFGMGAFGYHVLRGDLETITLRLRNAQLEQEHTRQLAVEAQLASLESHIRPHFLFNTLNTISSLIPEDPKFAESLVGKLAMLLRLSLDSNQERVASLERELQIVSDYLEIERARYGNRLGFRIDVPPELRSTEIPALSLQTLVENSVKYAVGSRYEGAEIRVAAYARDGYVFVAVSDNGPGFTTAAVRPGHGLDNLRRRLVALFGPTAALQISSEGALTTVSLRLPRTAGKTV